MLVTRNKIIQALLVCILPVSVAFSQLDNQSLYLLNTDSIPEKTIYFNVNSLVFFKNNEYFGPIADGYTLFGTQINPQLGFQLSPEIKLETGVFIRQDFGNDYFSSLAPTFTLKYQKKGFQMLFGNINSSLNHNLLEPLYNFERIITNRLENGAQFILNNQFIDLDTWVDWQTMIYKYSNYKERIWGGLTTRVLKYQKNKFNFHIPIQFTALHQGGQIDTAKGLSFTNISGSAGLATGINVDSKILQEINFNVHGLFKKSESYTHQIFPRTGTGIMANVEVKAFKTDFMLSYWFGQHFNTDFGGYIYASEGTTVRNPGVYQNNRQLLIFRVTKVFELAKDIYLTLRAEPNYDIGLSRFDYSYALYVSLNQNIFLNKKKKIKELNTPS